MNQNIFFQRFFFFFVVFCVNSSQTTNEMEPSPNLSIVQQNHYIQSKFRFCLSSYIKFYFGETMPKPYFQLSPKFGINLSRASPLPSWVRSPHPSSPREPNIAITMQIASPFCCQAEICRGAIEDWRDLKEQFRREHPSAPFVSPDYERDPGVVMITDAVSRPDHCDLRRDLAPSVISSSGSEETHDESSSHGSD